MVISGCVLSAGHVGNMASVCLKYRHSICVGVAYFLKQDNNHQGRSLFDIKKYESLSEIR